MRPHQITATVYIEKDKVSIYNSLGLFAEGKTKEEAEKKIRSLLWLFYGATASEFTP